MKSRQDITRAVHTITYHKNGGITFHAEDMDQHGHKLLEHKEMVRKDEIPQFVNMMVNFYQQFLEMNND